MNFYERNTFQILSCKNTVRKALVYFPIEWLLTIACFFLTFQKNVIYKDTLIHKLQCSFCLKKSVLPNAEQIDFKKRESYVPAAMHS